LLGVNSFKIAADLVQDHSLLLGKYGGAGDSLRRSQGSTYPYDGHLKDVDLHWSDEESLSTFKINIDCGRN